jgi:hypothetical protein
MRLMIRVHGDEITGMLRQGRNPICLTAQIKTRWGSNNEANAPLWPEMECKSSHMSTSVEG